MADSEVILDKDVRRIAGVCLVPRLRGPWEVYYEVHFVDGRVQQRPLSACACPDAIGAFEGRYFASAHADGQPGARREQPDDVDAKSESIAESHSHEDEDSRHLNDMPSDDSYWDDIVDSQGRSARSPTVRAAIRAKMAAGDESFRTPSKGSGDSTESSSSSSKSPASAATAAPRSATKSVGSTTSDSLLLELAASGAGANNSPSGKRPIRAAACRGIQLRRFHAQRQLNMLDDDVDLFADDDDSDASGSSPGAKMANMSVKDEVGDDAGKENVNDYGPDPWGGIPAPDPWTLPDARGRQQEAAEGLHHCRPLRAAGARDEDDELPSSSAKPVKTEKMFGVVGGLFADYFTSQARVKRATLAAKRVKTEPISDEDSAKHGLGVGPQRKRRLGQHTSPSVKLHKVGVITLSDDEDVVARLPAKKAKKFEEDTVVYVLSSDSEDHLDPEES